MSERGAWRVPGWGVGLLLLAMPSRVVADSANSPSSAPCRNPERIHQIEPRLEWSFRVASPLVDPVLVGNDGRYYVTTTDGTLFSLGRDGRLLWTYTGVGASASGATPRARGGVYYGTRAGRVYAIDETGRAQWVFYAPAGVASAIVESPKGYLAFVGDDSVLYAVSSRKGLLWMKALDGQLVAGPRLLEDGSFALVLRRHGRRGLWLWRATGYSDVSLEAVPGTGSDGDGATSHYEGHREGPYREGLEIDAAERWVAESSTAWLSSNWVVVRDTRTANWRWLRAGWGSGWSAEGCHGPAPEVSGHAIAMPSGWLALGALSGISLLHPNGDALSWPGVDAPKHAPSFDLATRRMLLSNDMKLDVWSLSPDIATGRELRRLLEQMWQQR